MSTPFDVFPKEATSQEYVAKLASSFAGLMSQMVREEKPQIIKGYLAVSQAITDLAYRMDSNLNSIRLGANYAKSNKHGFNIRDSIKGFAVNKAAVRHSFTAEILKDGCLAEALERLVESYGYAVSDREALLDAVRGDIKERFEAPNRYDRLPIEKAQEEAYAQDESHPIHALVHSKPAPEQGQAFTV